MPFAPVTLSPGQERLRAEAREFLARCNEVVSGEVFVAHWGAQAGERGLRGGVDELRPLVAAGIAAQEGSA